MLRSPGEIIEPKLIYKGAEAEIYLETWHGELVIRKTRITKPYRIAELDESIRRSRTSHEANMMHETRKMGVSVPTIRHIDPDSSTLIMEYVDGPTLKEELYRLAPQTRRARGMALGKLLGFMHIGGAVHGDLTVSNVLSEDGQLFLIDFGLSALSDKIEDRGVDLLLLNRALKSTHYRFSEDVFNAFCKGYASVLGRKHVDETVEKMREIERRGRYFERD